MFLKIIFIFCTFNCTTIDRNPKIVKVVFSSGRDKPRTYITFKKIDPNTPIYIYDVKDPNNIYSYRLRERIKSKIQQKQGYIIFELPKLPLKQIYAIVFRYQGVIYATKPFVFSKDQENYVFWTNNPPKQRFSWVLFGISMGILLIFIIGLIYLVMIGELRFC